jgi:hypothetical protein
MSTNLPEKQTDEVDLGQLFKIIGKGFERLFGFIYKIFNKLFSAFIFLVFFAKKHLIKLILALVIGLGLAFIKDNYGSKKYLSTVVIKQNYNTGEHLYNTLGYYQKLIDQKDSIELATLFNITPKDAQKLSDLKVESSLTENQKIALFDEFSKGLDSTLATKQKFKDFSKNLKDYEHSIQKITLESNGKSDFNKIFTQIVKNIESSGYFINEQKKDSVSLVKQEVALLNSIEESDSLQKVYQEVLRKSVEKTSGGETSITFEGSSKQGITKEFELFQSDLALRRELVEINRSMEDIKEIIEIVSLQGSKGGVLDTTANLFGQEMSRKIAYPIVLFFGVFIILLSIEFLKHLENYKD